MAILRYKGGWTNECELTNGTYIHTPKPYNPDVYIQEKGDYALYYYPDKENPTIGSWRITNFSQLGNSADLESSNLGSGLWYPTYRIPHDKKYEKIDDDENKDEDRWLLEFK